MSIQQLPFGALAIIAAVIFAPAPAQAQYNYYSSGSFMFNQNNYPDVTAATYRAQGAYSKPTNKPSATSKKQPQTKPHSDTPVIDNALPYTRDLSLSRKIRSDFLVDLAGRGSVTEVSKLAALMAKYDFVQVYASMARLQGLDSTSPDGLIALWYGQTWAIANQKQLPTARQYQAIAKQMRDTKANSGTWSKMTNAARQSFVEELAYAFIVQKGNYEGYRRDGNSAAVADMAERVQAGMINFGINMQTTKLTDSGLQE